MIYCFDIDGTLCNNTNGEYKQAVPHREVITRVNELYETGHTIILYTARGSTTGIDWRDFTHAQMKIWNVEYHHLLLGKPEADVYIDDKCIQFSDWMGGLMVTPDQSWVNSTNATTLDGSDLTKIIRNGIQDSLKVKRALLSRDEIIEKIERISKLLIVALSQGNKVLLFGNGGSAADAQHIAAELIGHFLQNRRALPAIALTVNPSVVTAISNDYDFTSVFARQIEALGRPGDVAIGISTSGNSPNVLKGVQTTRQLGMSTVGLTGATGGEILDFVDEILCVPSTNTQRVQEVHILIGHILCGIVEREVFPHA